MGRVRVDDTSYSDDKINGVRMRSMKDSLLWWLRVGAKLMLVVPGSTIALVLLGFVSQVAMLASFLVPLKVIMILGSGSDISLPFELFSSVNREVMVLTLSGIAVAFYIGYLVSGRLIERVAEAGSRRLLEQTSKVALFENQDQVAANAYKRYAGTLSRFLFAFFAGSVIGYLYAEVIWLVLGAGIVIVLIAVIGTRASHVFDRYLRDSFAKFANIASGIVFLGVFGLVVADFLWFTAPSFLVAIVALILGRQFLTQLTEAVVGIRQLVQQKKRISALFFSGEVLHQPSQTLIDGPWELLRDQGVSFWIDRMISAAVGRKTSVASIHWRQTGIRGVIFLDVETSERGERYLVKIFDKNRGAQALHEASLLLGEVDGIPAPRLIDASVLSGCHVHLMDVSGFDDEPKRQGVRKEIVSSLRGSLLAFEPPANMVQRYVRSKPMLWDRLDPEVFDILSIVALSDELPVVKAFRERVPEVKERLRSLPLCLHNPVTAPGTMLFKPASSPKSLHWGQWSVEPVGAAWPTDPDALGGGVDQLRLLSDKRPALRAVTTADFKLAAMMFELDREFRRENLRDCVRILEHALPLLES